MNIGKRLRELREAKGLSQGDVEHRTGLACSYLSRVENGHMVPSLPVLERWAGALEIGLSQIFAIGDEKPDARQLQEINPVGPQERTLLRLLGRVPAEDRALLVSIAREMVKRKGKRG